METEDFETAIAQLAAAAELLASDDATDTRMSAFQMRAFFRLRQGRLHEASMRQTSNDDLFKDTARAALTMAGQKHYLAAIALLDQARQLLVH
jgi:hypothetical protein